MTTESIKLPQDMPLFGGMSETGLQSLVAHAATVELPAGRCFFREGEAGQSMFVLEQGRVSVRNDALLNLYETDLEQFAIIQMNIAREISRRLRSLEQRVFEHNAEHTQS